VGVSRFAPITAKLVFSRSGLHRAIGIKLPGQSQCKFLTVPLDATPREK
jgi:hypothetical protein